jgi:hypothetical protein
MPGSGVQEALPQFSRSARVVVAGDQERLGWSFAGWLGWCGSAYAAGAGGLALDLALKGPDLSLPLLVSQSFSSFDSGLGSRMVGSDRSAGVAGSARWHLGLSSCLVGAAGSSTRCVASGVGGRASVQLAGLPSAVI